MLERLASGRLAHVPFRQSKLTMVLRDSFTSRNAQLRLIEGAPELAQQRKREVARRTVLLPVVMFRLLHSRVQLGVAV